MEYLFHGQWFEHSSKTILQEAEDPNELFLTNVCEDALPLGSIFQKVPVRKMEALESPPQNLTSGEFYYA